MMRIVLIVLGMTTAVAASAQTYLMDPEEASRGPGGNYQCPASRAASSIVVESKGGSGPQFVCVRFQKGLAGDPDIQAIQQSVSATSKKLDDQLKAVTEKLPEVLAQHVANQRVLEQLQVLQGRIDAQNEEMAALQKRVAELEQKDKR